MKTDNYRRDRFHLRRYRVHNRPKRIRDWPLHLAITDIEVFIGRCEFDTTEIVFAVGAVLAGLSGVPTVEVR